MRHDSGILTHYGSLNVWVGVKETYVNFKVLSKLKRPKKISDIMTNLKVSSLQFLLLIGVR